MTCRVINAQPRYWNSIGKYVSTPLSHHVAAAHTITYPHDTWHCVILMLKSSINTCSSRTAIPTTLTLMENASMDIYTILSSVKHNPHYLKRYVTFINECVALNDLDGGGYYEQHHICPKSKIDMFPEYRRFSHHPWNRAYLTERQHVIAHRMLHKTYGGSQTLAYVMMSRRHRVNRQAREQQSRVNSELFKGQNNPNFGNRWSPEQRLKASLREQGKTLPPETRTKQSVSRRRFLETVGVSDETRRKCSVTKVGSKNPNYQRPETSLRLNTDRFTCSVCGMVTNKGNWKRWHEGKCKSS